MPSSPAPWIAALRARFETQASTENAAHMKAYMRDQFEFFGIKTPERRAIIREFVKKNGLPELPELEWVVPRLWKEPQRELQHAAMELLHRRVNELDLGHLPILELMVKNKSWWDTVDYISYKLVGTLLAQHPKEERTIARRYSKSDNLWLNRVSIIFQLLRKKDTDTGLLEEVIRRHSAHEDFFIRKAIGWALRDCAYTDPEWVKRLVEGMPLSALSRREARKNL